MRSCEKAAALTSASHDRRLSLGERLQLTIHRLMCGPCRLHKQQILIMREQAEQLSSADTTREDALDDDMKARIRAKLREKSTS